METKEMIEKIVGALEDKKAINIQVADIGEKTILADSFIICTGTSSTHMKALADSVEEKIEEDGIRVSHLEGYNTGVWILMDYGNVVVHVMNAESREFYNLEKLWTDGVLKFR